MNSIYLNGMHCPTPGCECRDNEIWIHAKCHPQAGLEAYYVKSVQRIYLNCAECDQFVCVIDVK